MWTLRKSIWIRFTLIVILQSLITVGALYYITFSNFKRSIEWDLKRLETVAVQEWEGGKDFDALKEKLQFINNDEWNNFSFILRKSEKVLASYGDNSDKPGSLRNYDIETDWKNYKSFVFEQQHMVKGISVYTRAQVNLDLIDDTLWIFAACLPLILLPVFYFGIKVSRQVVNPLRKISKTLALIDEGNLESRIDKKSSNKEVSRLIKRLNSTLGKLEQSFQQAKRFNANAAHELKTPLAVIRGEIEVSLQKDRDAEEYQECLESCLEEVIHLNGLIETLLMISQPGAAESLQFEDRDAAEIVEDCLEIARLLAEEKRVSMICDLSSIAISCAPSLLQRCFMNLLENAVKYSPEGSSVSVILKEDNGDMLFTVQDKAEIIPEEAREGVFEPFFRLNSSEKGSGLGLALVRWAVELHGGEVCVKAAEGGNLFTVKMPLFK